MGLVPFSPESPRLARHPAHAVPLTGARYWVAKGQVGKARDVLSKYHANGDPDDELVNFQVTEIIAAHEDSLTRKNAGSWRECVATPGNRKRSLICVIVGLGSQWNGYGITS